MNFCLIFISLLFSADFPICTEDNRQQNPCGIFANNQYYVFWEDWRYYAVNGIYALYGARITSNGTVLDPNGKLLFKVQPTYAPAVAYDGANFLVVTTDSC